MQEAFRKQFEADLDHFLRLRAREFAVNGLLLIIVPGTLGDSHVGEGLIGSVSDAANGMAAEGRIDGSLLEDLIFPVYFPTDTEMEAAAHKTGSWEVLQRGGAALTQVHPVHSMTICWCLCNCLSGSRRAPLCVATCQ